MKTGIKKEEFRRFRECIKSGKTLDGVEVRRKKRSGEPIDYSIYAAPLHDEDRCIIGNIAVLVDITERKRLDEALKDASRRLNEAQRIAHIDGFLELLQKKTETVRDKQCRHYMDVISESAKKMGALIDDLLSFSRMGRQEMLLKPVDMGALVRDIIRELEPDTAGRDIEWRIGDLPAVSGDASMLRIVLTNLISNALKFTRSRPQARIEIGLDTGKESEIVIFVRDNGVGFDMNYADKLFGVFQRLHHTDEFEGAGIGPANAQCIIARHGGRARAEGKPNQGAAFFFSLPNMLQGGGDEKP